MDKKAETVGKVLCALACVAGGIYTITAIAPHSRVCAVLCTVMIVALAIGAFAADKMD